jgi:hypothetical protein
LEDEARKIASFKDPDGCAQLRLLLQEFERGIKMLSKEKEKQYKTMRQSLRLLEGMEEERIEKFNLEK